MTTTTTPDVKATAAKNGRYVETAEYAKAAMRFARGLERRVGDEMDIEALAYLDALARELDAMVVSAARKLQAGKAATEDTNAIPGHSYAEIGRVLDVTQQTAHRRFGPQRGDDRTLKARRQATAKANAARRAELAAVSTEG